MPGDPALVLWYSGGFSRDEGVKLFDTLQKELRKAGIKDQLVLDHSNEYGFTGSGYEPWPKYVDKLVELIDKEFPGRPLLLLGHSKGTCPAMSVATRLGERVLKTYVVACGGWLPGRKTPWEKLAEDFKRKGDQDLIAWFASLNPGNLLLETVAYCPEDQFEETVESSPWLTSKLKMMRLQYRDAMYPDMSKKVVDAFPAALCVVSPLYDGGSQPSEMLKFRKFSKDFEMWKFKAGHADILAFPDFLKYLAQDMLTFSGGKPPVMDKEVRLAGDLYGEASYLFVAERSVLPPPVAKQEAPKQLSMSEYRAIQDILKSQASEKAMLLEQSSLAMEMEDSGSGEQGPGQVGITRTVQVNLSNSRRTRTGTGAGTGALKKKGEPQQDLEVVNVDTVKGPLVEQADGSTRCFLEVPSFAMVQDNAPQYGPSKPNWKMMQSTDQKVVLEIVARMNRHTRESRKSSQPSSTLPEFLQSFKSFAPRSKDDEEHFWRHLHDQTEAQARE